MWYNLTMNTKTCYQYDEYGVYEKETLAFEDPKVEGIFPLPSHATFDAPPET